MTTSQDIDALLDRLDGSGSDGEWNAVQELRARLGARLPEFLLTRYQESKKWPVRSSCVFHSVRYARTSQAAVQLALLALNDRSKVVRYRACMLLACSLRKDLVPRIQNALTSLSNDTIADAKAAIDAIENENQNYFVDRDHSGLTTLIVH